MSVPARRCRVEFSGAMLGEKEDRKRILEITGYLELERNTWIIFSNSRGLDEETKALKV